MLVATMFCYLFFYTGRQTAGFAIPGIHKELGISLTTLGWMSATLFWCYAVGQFINGNLGDRHGARLMMSLGAVISCALNWVVSFGQGVLTLFIPWGANGYAQSMAWAPGSRLISNWWGHKERGKAFGFYVFAAGMSSVIAFTTSLIVLDVFQLGWRCLLTSINFTQCFRERPWRLSLLNWFLPLFPERRRDAHHACSPINSSQSIKFPHPSPSLSKISSTPSQS